MTTTTTDMTEQARAVLADPAFDANASKMLLRAAAQLPMSLRDGEKIWAGRPMATLRWLHDAGLVQRTRWAATDLGHEVARLIREEGGTL